MCIYVCACVGMCVHARLCACASMCELYVFVLLVHECLYTCMYVHASEYVCVCINVCVYEYVNMYVCGHMYDLYV